MISWWSHQITNGFDVWSWDDRQIQKYILIVTPVAALSIAPMDYCNHLLVSTYVHVYVTEHEGVDTCLILEYQYFAHQSQVFIRMKSVEMLHKLEWALQNIWTISCPLTRVQQMSTHLIPVEIQWLRGGMNETLRQSPATNCTQWSEGVWHCGTQPHDRRCINTVYVNHTNKQLCQRHQLVCTEPQWPQQLSESHVGFTELLHVMNLIMHPSYPNLW